MANESRIYFLSEKEFLVHKIGGRRFILDWVSECIGRNEDGVVLKYLFQKLPGLVFVTKMRHSGVFDECIHILAQYAPKDVRQRLAVESVIDGTPLLRNDFVKLPASSDELINQEVQFDRMKRNQFFALWNTPLRVLDIEGLQLILPGDLEVLLDLYQNKLYVDNIGLVEKYYDEWQSLVLAHKRSTYDLALVFHEL
jgi:hypothetical protein